MKHYYNIGITMMVATCLAATSCSDFDDYNEVPAENNVSASLTLWENIKNNKELSQFASLVQKSGYDKLLSASRTYTVWAPLNETFDFDKWSAADSSDLRFKFIENHIANFNHYISSPINERIQTLNSKTYSFEGNHEKGTFGGVQIAKSNVPGSNGVLYTLDGEAIYHYNFYEYLTANQENDSLAKYILQYEQKILDENNSVAGPIVDGIQTWEDSVMILKNGLLNDMDADIDLEDSSFVMLLPTNEAWLKAYETIKKRYNYSKGKVISENFYMDKTTFKQEQVTDEVNAAYLSDSLTRQLIALPLVFSTKNWYNRWLEGVNPDFNDTLQCTVRGKFSNPDELLRYKSAEIQMSNGMGYVVDSLAFKPWEWYTSYASRSNCDAYKYANTPVSYTVTNLRSDLPAFDFCLPKLFYTGTIKYERLEPKLTSSEMSIYYNINSVTAGTYSVYCIMLPPDGDADHAAYEPEPEMLPSLFNASINVFNPETSKTMELFFKPGEPTPLKEGPKSSDTEGKCKEWAFSNDINKLDPVYLGDVTLDVCYRHLTNCHPTIKIAVPKLHKDVTGKYSRILRIARVIMVPVELSKSNQ